MDALDDNEIIRLVESAPYLPGSKETLVQISDDTVVKLSHEFSSSCSEALVIDLVCAFTSTAVLHVRRVIKHNHDNGDSLIVMDMVQRARQLDLCWPSLSCRDKVKVILTVRYYMQQLQHICSTTAMPGPLGPQLAKCHSLQYDI